MKREVTTSQTRTVRICDLCEKQIDNAFSCSICGREHGYCCGKLLLAYESGQCGFLDLAFRVCKECEQASYEGWYSGSSCMDRIKHRVKIADEGIGEMVEQWKEWAKKRREQRKEGGK